MTLIDKEAALDALMAERKHLLGNGQMGAEHILTHHGYNVIDELPPVQSTQEIIRCKDCKHWNLQVGNVKGDGLGSCDFHNVNLVTGEGFCYWADRRGGSDGTD